MLTFSLAVGCGGGGWGDGGGGGITNGSAPHHPPPFTLIKTTHLWFRWGQQEFFNLKSVKMCMLSRLLFASGADITLINSYLSPPSLAQPILTPTITTLEWIEIGLGLFTKRLLLCQNKQWPPYPGICLINPHEYLPIHLVKLDSRELCCFASASKSHLLKAKSFQVITHLVNSCIADAFKISDKKCKQHIECLQGRQHQSLFQWKYLTIDSHDALLKYVQRMLKSWWVSSWRSGGVRMHNDVGLPLLPPR